MSQSEEFLRACVEEFRFNPLIQRAIVRGRIRSVMVAEALYRLSRKNKVMVSNLLNRHSVITGAMVKDLKKRIEEKERLGGKPGRDDAAEKAGEKTDP